MAERIRQANVDKKKFSLIVKELGYFLADTMILYVKTLNFHWNMVGSEFFMYHRLLEEQYKELADALDMLAERIRMLGAPAPATLVEFLQLARLKENGTKNQKMKQEKMIQELVRDHEAMVGSARSLIDFCDEALDQGTSDLLIERIRSHDKSAWLLRSHL